MVFVGVLGASNHTFVDVTRSRSLPTRPWAPRDNAKRWVQHLERRIMAPLRNQTFSSLGELREAIARLRPR